MEVFGFFLLGLFIMLGFINRRRLKCESVRRQYGRTQQAIEKMNNKPYIFPTRDRALHKNTWE